MKRNDEALLGLLKFVALVLFPFLADKLRL